MEKQYAQALQRLIDGGMEEGKAFDKLVVHLKASGRMKILPLLLRELKRNEARKRIGAPLLEVASAGEAAEAESAAKAEGVTAKAVVNPTLIRGWRLRHANVLIDRSGKRALVDLYRRITN